MTVGTRRMSRAAVGLGFGLGIALAAATPAAAQGIVIDRRPEIPVAGGFTVERIDVDAHVQEQVARVRVAQTFANPSSRTIEAEYLFPVPDAGAIQDVVLQVDGKELVGELMEADKARRVYESIVRRKRDPALVEYMGTGLIKTSVFPIPAGAERTVSLSYTQVLPRDRDVVEFAYPFGTQKYASKPIQTLALRLRIESRTPIKSIYSPSHDVETKQPSDHEALVTFEERNVIPTADLRVLYTLAEGGLGLTVLSERPSEGEDGYLLLLASPDVAGPDDADAQPEPKTVVFVIDRSGSMSGKKIEQARDALTSLINNLQDKDTFNILVYDDRVETFRPELERYDNKTRVEAVRFVENLRAGGSTNIDAALRTALGMLPEEQDQPRYVLFLTDGLPTAGETNEMKIAANARKANRAEARVFSFGVGYDVNARLLDRLSADHSGTTVYVKPGESLEGKVARFQQKLTSPVLTDLEITISGTDLNRSYPGRLPDLFEGGQLVWVGRYTDSGPAVVTLSGRVGGERRRYQVETDLASGSEPSRYDFIESLWAARRIGDIIDQIDLHGENPELTKELVELSTRYGILTPYTSFLANEETDHLALGRNSRRAGEQLRRLQEVQGAGGVGQRANKAFYQQAERGVAASGAIRVPEAEAAQPNVRLGMGVGGGQQAQAGGGVAGRAASGAATRARDFEGNEVAVGTVRHLGKKTFYRRDGRWVDADVSKEEAAKATVIRQFSEGYFKLVRSLSKERNKYLSFKEPVIVKLGETVYRIEPAPTDG